MRLALSVWLVAATALGQLCPNDITSQVGCAETCSVADLVTQGASTWECVARSAVNVGTATALADNGANCSAGA